MLDNSKSWSWVSILNFFLNEVVLSIIIANTLYDIKKNMFDEFTRSSETLTE